MKVSPAYVLVLLPLLGAAAVTACSSSVANPADGGTDGAVLDTGAPKDAGAESAADACVPYTGAIPKMTAQCHDLVNSAPVIPITVDLGAMPVGTGGTPGDGLYHMTEVRTYPGSPLTGVTFKITVVVVGDTSYLVNDNSNEPTTERRITKKNPDGGAGIIVCTTKDGGAPPMETSSTATCSSLTTYDTNYKFSATITKQ